MNRMTRHGFLLIALCTSSLAGCTAPNGSAASSPPPVTVTAASPVALAVADTRSVDPGRSPLPEEADAAPVSRVLPPARLEPGMTYEQLKAALGKPDRVDREQITNGVRAYWGPSPVEPGQEPKYQVEAVFRGHSIQRRRPVGLDVRAPFPGTLHGLSLGGSPDEAGLKRGYSQGVDRDSKYMLSFEEENGEVTTLSVWRDGVVVWPVNPALQ